MSDDSFYDPKPPTLEECARVVKKLTICINFLKRESLRSSMEEPLICNQQVAGSSPAVGSLTDEERGAIREGADALYGDSHDAEAATLWRLLERLS